MLPLVGFIGMILFVIGVKYGWFKDMIEIMEGKNGTVKLGEQQGKKSSSSL